MKRVKIKVKKKYLFLLLLLWIKKVLSLGFFVLLLRTRTASPSVTFRGFIDTSYISGEDFKKCFCCCCGQKTSLGFFVLLLRTRTASPSVKIQRFHRHIVYFWWKIFEETHHQPCFLFSSRYYVCRYV